MSDKRKAANLAAEMSLAELLKHIPKEEPKAIEEPQPEPAAPAPAPRTNVIEIDGRTLTVPPQTGPIDRFKWRLAEEPPGTDLTAPWESVRCIECQEIMFRRNPKADMCEFCTYMMYETLSEGRVKQDAVITRTYHDPFRPKI